MIYNKCPNKVAIVYLLLLHITTWYILIKNFIQFDYSDVYRDVDITDASPTVC